MIQIDITFEGRIVEHLRFEDPGATHDDYLSLIEVLIGCRRAQLRKAKRIKPKTIERDKGLAGGDFIYCNPQQADQTYKRGQRGRRPKWIADWLRDGKALEELPCKRRL